MALSDRLLVLWRPQGQHYPAAWVRREELARSGKGVPVGGRANGRIALGKDIEKGMAGQLFEDFLKEQGTLEDTNERATKRVLAFQPDGEIKQQFTADVETTRRLDSGRSQTGRLPDPEQ